MEVSRIRMLAAVGLSACAAALVGVLPLSLIARIASSSGGAHALVAGEHGWGKAGAFMLVVVASLAALTAAIGWLLLPRLASAEVEYVPFFLALCIGGAAAALICLVLAPAGVPGAGVVGAAIFVVFGSWLAGRDAVAVGYIAPAPERPRLVIDDSLDDLPAPRVALDLGPAPGSGRPRAPAPEEAPASAASPPAAPSAADLAEAAAALVRLVGEWRALSGSIASASDPDVVRARIADLESLARTTGARLQPYHQDVQIAAVGRALAAFGEALAKNTALPLTDDARAGADSVCESVATSLFLRDWVTRHRPTSPVAGGD